MLAKRKFTKTHQANHSSASLADDEDDQPLARKLKLNNTKAKGKPPVDYKHDDALMFVRDNCKGDPRVSVPATPLILIIPRGE